MLVILLGCMIAGDANLAYASGVTIKVEGPSGSATGAFTPASPLSPAANLMPATSFLSGVQLGSGAQALTAGRSKSTFILATIDGWPETKTEMELQCIPIFGKDICTDIPVIYTRSSKMELIGEVELPDDVNMRVASVLRTCVLSALGASIGSGIILSPASAIPAFKTALVACLTAAAGDLASKLASEMTVGLHTDITPGAWQRH